MVQIVNWNPSQKIFKKRPLRWLPLEQRVNNFGDLIGPMVVKKLLSNNEIENTKNQERRLLTVGSIIHFAQNYDTLWGSGVIGNEPIESYKFQDLDIRAVRGPNTHDFLQKNFDLTVPNVYGDPAILVPFLFPEIKKEASQKASFELTIIPHFHDYQKLKNNPNVLSPRDKLPKVLDRIARSEFVVASSLHAVILAESFGVPAQLFQSSTEHYFKYEDYYLATGRESFRMARDYREAIKFGGESPMLFDSKPLLDSFPYDIFS